MSGLGSGRSDDHDVRPPLRPAPITAVHCHHCNLQDVVCWPLQVVVCVVVAVDDEPMLRAMLKRYADMDILFTDSREATLLTVCLCDYTRGW